MVEDGVEPGVLVVEEPEVGEFKIMIVLYKVVLDELGEAVIVEDVTEEVVEKLLLDEDGMIELLEDDDFVLLVLALVEELEVVAVEDIKLEAVVVEDITEEALEPLPRAIILPPQTLVFTFGASRIDFI